MDASRTQAVIDALIADHERQGGRLSEDDVLRLALKRGLETEHIEQVLRTLRVEGIEVETESEVGFDSRFDTHSTGGTSSPDLLGKYLKEIAEFRLLTAQDEVRLGRRIQAGLRAEEQQQLRHTSSPELDRIITDGRDARVQMMSANLRLVFSIARKHAARAGMDVLDLAQDGVFGLARAVVKFDPSLGFKLSTYATWWIQQAIFRAIENSGRMIRFPVHAGEKLRRIYRVRRALRREHGGAEPSLRDIAEQVGLSEGKVQFLLDVGREPQSLDTPTPDGESTLGDFVAARAAKSPEELAVEKETAKTILAMIQSLTPREALVLKLRFGLEDGTERTLEQVGELLGLTRERIRQIQNKALKRLRHPTRARQLHAHWDAPKTDREGDGDDD